MKQPILVLDLEFRGNGSIRDIGVAFVIQYKKGRVKASRPDHHNLIKIGEEPPKYKLREACEILKNMGTQEMMWASWGTSDRHELKKQTDDLGLEMPVGYFHIDIAPMYAALFNLDRPIRLKAAAEQLTGRFIGSQHHADDDSFNAARILAELINRFDRS